MKDKDLPILHSQYHDCWCPGYGARTSAAMVLTLFFQNILAPVSDGLTHLHLGKMAAISADDILNCIFLNEKLRIFIKPSIGLDNGLAPNRPQAIIWTNADPIHWRIYAALGGDEFWPEAENFLNRSWNLFYDCPCVLCLLFMNITTGQATSFAQLQTMIVTVNSFQLIVS